MFNTPPCSRVVTARRARRFTAHALLSPMLASLTRLILLQRPDSGIATVDDPGSRAAETNASSVRRSRNRAQAEPRRRMPCAASCASSKYASLWRSATHTYPPTHALPPIHPLTHTHHLTEAPSRLGCEGAPRCSCRVPPSRAHCPAQWSGWEPPAPSKP